MKKLLLVILFVPIFVACEKEEVGEGEPLMQMYFINFVNESGENLFEINEISTSEFHYVSGNSIVTWEDILAGKEFDAAQIKEVITPNYSHYDTVVGMLNNDFLLLEHYQGKLERERVISINGVQHTFRYSLDDGFYQNGELLEYSTDAIDKHQVDTYGVYLHTIVLENF